jgi:hypothetical protein
VLDRRLHQLQVELGVGPGGRLLAPALQRGHCRGRVGLSHRAGRPHHGRPLRGIHRATRTTPPIPRTAAAAAAATPAPAPAHAPARWLDSVARAFKHVLEEELLDREGEAGDVSGGAAAEVRGEHLGVEGGGHEHQLEVGAPRKHVAQNDQQEVLVHAALVDLVHLRHQAPTAHVVLTRRASPTSYGGG